MEGVAFLIILAIVCLLSGPIALILSIGALNKIRELHDRLEGKGIPPLQWPEVKVPRVPPEISLPPPVKTPEVVQVQPAPEPVFKPTPASPPVAKPISFMETETAARQTASLKQPKQPTMPPPQVVIELKKEKAKDVTISLEQRIGTRWVLIAGVITVFISAGFFLKFAYEHSWIGPWGRIGIVSLAGIVCLAVGEITRRRGYEIAAKGTTALGFAILYAADFAAYRLYGLIGPTPAFATAIIITAAAFAYAVVLDEVVAAFLALLGGFITPVLISTGENMPVPLFGYVLVLSTGAMLCAYWRKWRVINLLAFVGTFLLYSGWFEKFFRSQLHAANPPEQLTIALGWLGVFFGVYLVLPLLYGLVNRVNARKDDVWLVVINASWTFFYLWTVLFERYQTGLALCAAGLSAAHLAMMGLAFIRCREDFVLRQTLLVIGLAFLTTAIPLYWQMNAAILGWAIEGAILVFIGIRYRSILTQIGGAAAIGLACAKLVWQLPMHTDAFRLALNPAFGIWVFVSIALWFCHFLYRKDSRSIDDPASILAQIFYAVSVLVLFCAATLEWAAHCKYNLLVGYDLHYISRGQSIIFSAAVLLFAVRPMCPRGRPMEIFSLITLTAGAIFVACSLPELHTEKFLIFVNWDFAAVFVFLISIFFCHIRYRLIAKTPQSEAGILSQALYAVAMLVLFCAVTFEWAAHCKYNLLVGYDFHYISRGQPIILAIAALLFAIRPICPGGRLTNAFNIITLMAGTVFVAFAFVRLHTEKFLIFVNWDFAAVFVFIMTMLGCHIKYRLAAESPQSKEGNVSQALYAVLGLLFLAAIGTEWYWHCVYNLQAPGYSPAMIRGQIIVFSAVLLGFAVRPLCPRCLLPKLWAAGLAVVGSCFAMIMYIQTHTQGFVIFANPTFTAAGVLIAALFTSAYLLNRRKDEEPEGKFFAVCIALLAVFVLWVVLSEEIYEYWRCRDLYVKHVDNWDFIANMWMSVAWAVYGLALLTGGFWRKLKTLRYLGLAVLGVLLLKAFIVDMSAVSTIYRIMAFLATGVTLVGVSYLYQFLRKKGFFDTTLAKDQQNENGPR
jgi:uncharacterized membrane protein